MSESSSSINEVKDLLVVVGESEPLQGLVRLALIVCLTGLVILVPALAIVIV